MSRKINITVTATVNVPLTVTYEAIVVVDEDVPTNLVARAVIDKSAVSDIVLNKMDFEDSTISSVVVDGQEEEGEDFLDLIHDYIMSEESNVRYVDHNVTDSR